MSEQNNKKSSIENVKLISDLVSSGELSSLSKNATKMRKDVDNLLTKLKDVKAKYKPNDEATSESLVQVEKEQVLEKTVVAEVETQKTSQKEVTPEKTEKAETKATEKKVEQVSQPKTKEKPGAPISNEPAAAKTSAPTDPAAPKAPVLFQSTSLVSAQERAMAIQKRIELQQAQSGGGTRRYENKSRPAYGQNNNGGQRPGGYGGGQRPQTGGAPRPQGARPGQGFGYGKDNDQDQKNFQRKPTPKPGPKPIPIATKPDTSNKPKRKTQQDEKKAMTKRTLIRKGFIPTNYQDEDQMGSRKVRTKKKNQIIQAEKITIDHAIITTSEVSIKVLSEKIGVTAVEITKKLFQEGIMKTVNEFIDFETAQYIALFYDVTLEYKPAETAEDILSKAFEGVEDAEKDLSPRPPIVTIMGHVDHGKTSLLDYIKNSNVTSTEAGGITQHIGAYSIELNKRKITFIDTPGHEAFTSMRQRGAQITDIAILVVAADDSVKPQTIEAINHIKAAGVEMIVAINKMDKVSADVNKVFADLSNHEVLTEAWGGTVIAVPVSAHTGEGVEELLESILTVADVLELKANPNRQASGSIIEAKLDKGKGPVATILVKNGTLKIGDNVIAGFASGRIRAMLDDKGRNLKEAGPSQAVSVLGFQEVPEAGDAIMAVGTDKLSRQVVDERLSRLRQEMMKGQGKVTLEDAFKNIEDGQIKNLNLIVKADVQGSLEAVKQALNELSNAEVKVRIIHGAVGAVNESDVMLASTSQAVVIAFNVRPDIKTKQLAERDGVDIRTYRIIYDAIDEVKKSLTGMLEPTFKEKQLGTIEVRNVFKITGVGTVAGGYVIDGKVTRDAEIRLLREGVIIHQGMISSLKRMKDDAKEVAKGYECGISIKDYNDIKEGDKIEAFVMEEEKREL